MTLVGTAQAEDRRRRERLYRVLSRSAMRSRLDERALLVVGAALVAGGLAAVVVGYLGASRTVLVAGQIPYLISGGLVGMSLVFLGAFTYFAYWLAVTVRESRADRAAARIEREELRRALAELTHAVQALAAAPGRPRAPRREG